MDVTLRPAAVRACLLMFAAVCARGVSAQSNAVDLVLDPGRPLRVALDERVVVRREGQPVTGTLVDALYAYDRVVVPAGTMVLGHFARLDDPPRVDRMRAIAGGDFSPSHIVTLQFDAFLMPDGRQISFGTVVTGSTGRVTLKMAASAPGEPGDSDDKADEGRGVTAAAKARAQEQVDRAKEEAAQLRDRIKNAREEAAQKARQTLDAIKAPGKMARLRDAAVNRLPYHPQQLSKGTVFEAELTTPVRLGAAGPVEAAPAGTPPSASAILNARLVTPLDSSKTARGSAVEAVLTEPVFSDDHRLVLPEGTRLRGEVTRVSAARHLHRNGQLRFLFETVEPRDGAPFALLGSMSSVEVGDGNDVSVDDEGGARASSSKTRFIAPALGLLAMRASLRHHEREIDGDADDNLGPRPGGGPVTFGIGGFLGWSIAGAAIGQVSRPIAIGLTAVGVGRSVYSAVFGKGRDVNFPADTRIQIELSPKTAAPAR
ncbi:MAG TPA: hypothetical protein VEU08_23145 [Vicinamibacterales bacterium]|nr:hypothetical protein [Vicinamibacterales bacterium]